MFALPVDGSRLRHGVQVRGVGNRGHVGSGGLGLRLWRPEVRRPEGGPESGNCGVLRRAGGNCINRSSRKIDSQILISRE